MNQFAAFFSPTALPNAAGAVVHAGQAGAPDEGFANVLAQLQALIRNPGATAATNDGIPAQFQNLLATTPVASAPTADANSPATPDTPAQVETLVDLLALIGSPTTGETQIAAAAQATGPTTTLAAQLAALQVALQDIQAQPGANEASTPINTVSERSPIATIAAAQLGLRGTLVATQDAGQTNEAVPAAKNQQTATPQIGSAAAIVATLPTTQAKQDASAQPQNIAKAAAAPKRAATLTGTAAQTEPQAPAQNPKALEIAVSNAATTLAPQSSTAQNTTPDQSGAAGAQPAQPSTAVPAAVVPNVVSAQQFSVTVAAAPQAAVPLEALAVHIARKFEGGASQFEIRLHPAELGQLDISLSVADDGRVQAVLRAERPETLDILQRDARTLEQQLRQAGLDVGSNALSFSLSNGNGGRQAPFTGWPAFADANDVAGTAKEEAASKYVAVRVRDGIDIRV